MADKPDRPLAALIPFDPVATRPRVDGWSPDRQREFIEALADCGIIREAAGRVGMSEQSVGRLCRRADGRSFAHACEVAFRLGARRLRSIAVERAVEGTIKRHYYHGELKAEERVYDNRLLIYLLGRLGGALALDTPAATLERGWGDLVDKLDTDDPQDCDGDEIWEEEGEWWTDFPPPEGFAGTEHGRYGEPAYRRQLSPRETEALDAEDEDGNRQFMEDQYRRRDRFFGFAGGRAISCPMEAELSEPSEPSAPADEDGEQGGEA